MFGYVTPLKGELKVKEYNLFRSYYCGLCLSIKKDFGNLPRSVLNYDMTFLALLLDGLNEDKVQFKHSRCFIHPLQKKAVLLNNNALSYAGCMNVSLSYFKLLDDFHDDKNLKSKIFSLILSPYKNKFPSCIKEINEIIKDNLNKLSTLEESKNFISIDEICHPFGVIVGEILRLYPYKITDDSPEVRENLYNLGYFLGKWIYLIDAVDDLKEDIDKNKFNPINYLYNDNNMEYDEFLEFIKERLEFNILNCGYSCKKFLNKLPLHKNNNILYNIIELGMMDKYTKTINKCNCNNTKEVKSNESI